MISDSHVLPDHQRGALPASVITALQAFLEMRAAVSVPASQIDRPFARGPTRILTSLLETARGGPAGVDRCEPTVRGRGAKMTVDVSTGVSPSKIFPNLDCERKRRLADGSHAAQERGEVATRADQNLLPEQKKVSVEEIGLTHKAIHEARIIRDAEAADPGIVRRVADLFGQFTAGWLAS